MVHVYVDESHAHHSSDTFFDAPPAALIALFDTLKLISFMNARLVRFDAAAAAADDDDDEDEDEGHVS